MIDIKDSKWKVEIDSFNFKFSPQYGSIVRVIFENGAICMCLLDNMKELHITNDQRIFKMSQMLLTKDFKHVAQTYDCVELEQVDERGDNDNLYYVICEYLQRETLFNDEKQAGINLFVETWEKALGTSADIHNKIARLYADKEKEKELEVETLLNSMSASGARTIALALHDAYRDIFELNPNAMIWPLSVNIGISDGLVKVTNIGLR